MSALPIAEVVVNSGDHPSVKDIYESAKEFLPITGYSLFQKFLRSSFDPSTVLRAGRLRTNGKHCPARGELVEP